MSVTSRQALRVRAELACHGQPVILPGGVVVQGIADQAGRAARGAWPVTGQAWRPGKEPNPAVCLQDADAAALQVQDPILIDGVGYEVSEVPRADGSGITRVELAPLRAGAVPDGSRWR